jgi:hypothetical protein
VTAPDVGPTRFRQFSNPATGESVQFTATPQDDGEDVVRFNWRSMPGGAIIEDVHPRQEERFAISAGEAHFTLADEHPWSARARRSSCPLASATRSQTPDRSRSKV